MKQLENFIIPQLLDSQSAEAKQCSQCNDCKQFESWPGLKSSSHEDESCADKREDCKA
jgi:hypothetical protein